MKLNDKYCELLDADFGYDNQSLADKIEKTSDKFAIGFAEWICEKANIPNIKGKMNTTLEIYKKEKGL
jgi:hypothetical protein